MIIEQKVKKIVMKELEKIKMDEKTVEEVMKIIEAAKE